MQRLTVTVMNGQPKVLTNVEFLTVQDVLTHLNVEGNFSAVVDGEPVELSQPLEADVMAFIDFTEKVKGAVAKKAVKCTKKTTPTKKVATKAETIKKAIIATKTPAKQPAKARGARKA